MYVGNYTGYENPMDWAPNSDRHINYDSIIRQTDKAYLIGLKLKSGEIKEKWLPKSQVTVKNDCIIIPEWLTEKILDEINSAN